MSPPLVQALGYAPEQQDGHEEPHHIPLPAKDAWLVAPLLRICPTMVQAPPMKPAIRITPKKFLSGTAISPSSWSKTTNRLPSMAWKTSEI